ncbi:DUF488 family protein [Microbacterium sp. 3J1]|uniref:DUF488 domain-containing protein n=1 Tax=Microbacterium sp. 3J1 TaxID=861269 RepID=UPI000A90E440|nr:DUF488 domain-containing protein [Microbacterium sp. 3J1]
MASDLLSVGYEGLSIDALVSRLRIHGATVLADVRLNAISRKQGFSKRALAAALADAGIEYLHLPQLGNPKDNRAGYGEPGTAAGDGSRDAFRATLSTPEAQDALRRISAASESGPVAVFCYEADETCCHRQQVLDAVRLLSTDSAVPELAGAQV